VADEQTSANSAGPQAPTNSAMPASASELERLRAENQALKMQIAELSSQLAAAQANQG
jgi:cell division protein FtsB